MEISPQRVRSAEFKTVRKGADPDEIKAFLNDVADELERAQNQSTAMEARARAAIARLQEMNDGSRSEEPRTAAPASTPEATPDEADTISRTLLLAQRTADSTVADANAEAERLVREANAEASTTLESARELSARLIEEARVSARQAGEGERITVQGEVDALKARRDFLESDVEQLELFLTDQRSRLREAATALIDVTERVPGGLGEVRPPLLSASDDDDGRADAPSPAATEAPADAEATDESSGHAPSEEPADEPDDDLVIVADLADGTARDGASADDDVAGDPPLSWASDDGAPTQAMPTITPRDDDDAQTPVERRDEEILFSFDDDRR
jgi:cell division septum initiation protein DivIVA